MYSFSNHAETFQVMDHPYDIVDSPSGNPQRRTIVLHREAIDHPALAADPCTMFGDASGAMRLEIDCSAIVQANSMLIAWLIRVAQSVKPRRVILLGVNERQAVLFRRMRLDHIVDLPLI